MKTVLFALEAVTACLAWLLARRRSDHRPIAWLLTMALFGDVAQWAIDVSVLASLRTELSGVPWTGRARVVGHVVDAVWLAWPAAVVGAALAVFAKQSARYALVGWAVTVAVLVAVRPDQGDALLAVQSFAVIVAGGLGASWYRKRESAATPAQALLVVIIANEALSVLAALWAGPFERWSVMHLSAMLILCAVGLLQGRSLWALKSSLSAPS